MLFSLWLWTLASSGHEVFDGLELSEVRTNESLGLFNGLESLDVRSVLKNLDEVLDISIPVRLFSYRLLRQVLFDPGYRHFCVQLGHVDMSILLKILDAILDISIQSFS